MDTFSNTVAFEVLAVYSAQPSTLQDETTVVANVLAMIKLFDEAWPLERMPR